MAKINTIEIDHKTLQAIQSFAVAHNRPLEDVVKDAMKLFLGVKEREIYFLAEADEAWQDFQKTGEGLPFDEVAEWMNTWGKNKTDTPKCRKL